MKFPANCGHWICVDCMYDLVFRDESVYHLSPVPFGCLPCPNGCVNPKRGKQCYCKEYDEIRDLWEKDYPDEFEQYNDAENMSIDIGEIEPGSVFGSESCPLCQKTYEKIPKQPGEIIINHRKN